MIGLFLLLSLSAPETKSFAVVVGHNRSADNSLAPLRYADDDGAKWFELLSLGQQQSILLSVLDADTQLRFPNAARESRPPSRAALQEALAETFAAISEAKQKGHRTVFYFVYAGHGSIGSSGEGEMHLLDGRFSRADLYRNVIASSPATVNHVIIDACNAYLMVARRGSDSEAVELAVQSFLAKEQLAQHPNTGFLLSTSNAADVHEWARFESGIFSHEVRSGLTGAADVDGDGLVAYDEIRAFVSAANARVQDPRARLTAYAEAPPQHLAEPLFDGRKNGAPTLIIPATLAGRWFLEDARGVRYADFHFSPQAPLRLTLVPSPLYFLRAEDGEIRIPLEGLQAADASQWPKDALSLSTRGAEDLTFRRDLFAVPFGRAYFEGFRASLEQQSLVVQTSPPPDHRGWRIAAVPTGAAGLVAIAVGTGFGVASNQTANQYRNAIGARPDVDALREDAKRQATTANVLYAAGGALVVSAVVMWLLPEILAD